MKVFFLSLILAGTILSCNEEQKGKNEKEPVVQKLTEAQQTVKSFFIWYMKNRERLSNIGLFLERPKEDTVSAYAIDFPGTKQYKNELKKSGFLSDKYLNVFTTFFIEADSTFKVTHQNDGPPQGFEADIVLGIQDFSDVENIDKVRFENTKQIDNKCTTSIVFPPESVTAAVYTTTYTASLTKYSNKWLIDVLDKRE